jgi:hypothetical protein
MAGMPGYGKRERLALERALRAQAQVVMLARWFATRQWSLIIPNPETGLVVLRKANGLAAAIMDVDVAVAKIGK